jgi:hypothetical protein
MDRTRVTLVGGDVVVILVLIGVVVALRRRLTNARTEAQIARDEFLVVEQRLSECRAELRSARALE